MVTGALAVASAVSMMPAASVSAQASTATFSTSIVYQNPNNAAASVSISFYPEGSGTADPVTFSTNVNAYGSGTVLVGSLGIASPFKGSAVISSDQNIVAAAAQVPTNASVNQILSTAFGSADGTSNLYLTTFLGGNASAATSPVHSVFGVQNTEAESIRIRAQFINTAGTLVAAPTVVLPANAAKHFDARTPASIDPAFATYVASQSFNGSVVVTATKVSDNSAAKIVGVSQELWAGIVPNRAYAFEAIPQTAGASTVYIPTALCEALATNLKVTTFFAAQSLATSGNVDFTVTYINADGSTKATQSITAVTPGQKRSFNPCQAPGIGFGANWGGSAVLAVSGGQPAAVIGKAGNEPVGFDYQTAYLGQGSGAQRLAIPYMRYGTGASDLQSFVSAQNIGAAAIPAGQLSYKFYNTDGTLARTCTNTAVLNKNAKVSGNPATNTGTMSCTGSVTQPWSGSVIIEGPAGAQLIAINRTQKPSNVFITEDYNGVFLP
jgi:hypothetical protein